MNRYWLLLLLLGCAVDCRVAAAQDPLVCAALTLYSPTVRAEGVAEQIRRMVSSGGRRRAGGGG